MIFLLSSHRSTSSNEPRDVLVNYLNAVKNQDAELAASYVIDKRYVELEPLIKFYKESFKDDKLVDYRITKENKISNNKVSFEIELSINSNQTVKTEFNLIHTNGDWKVFFSGHDEPKQ
ncbi:hypothetical protein D1872_235700 [compost metagenome]